MRLNFLTLALIWPACSQVMVKVDSRTMLTITTELTGGNVEKPEIRGEVSGADYGTIHRVLRDATGKIVFGYDLEVSPAGRYHLLVHPVSHGYAQTLQNTPIPTFDRDRVLALASGDRTEIELLVQPGTGRKVVDVLALIDRRAIAAMDREPGAQSAHLPTGSLHFSRAQISAFSLSETYFDGAMTGSNIGMHLNGIGAIYIAAEQPHDYPQFREIGLVRGNKLNFMWTGMSILVRSAEPILPNGGSGKVWIYYDPQYHPKTAGDWNIAAGSVQWLLGNEE